MKVKKIVKFLKIWAHFLKRLYRFNSMKIRLGTALPLDGNVVNQIENIFYQIKKIKLEAGN